MILYEDKKALRSIVDAVRTSTLTDFYRQKYSDVPDEVTSVTELPFLTRQELVAIVPDDRCYLPKSEVAFVAYTSGTTGGKPLISFFGGVENYHVDPSWGLPIERILVVFPPLNKNFCGTFIQQCREAVRPVTPVFGDPANLAASAYLGHELGVDALYATPSYAFALAPHLAITMTHERIKLLVISGETITIEKRASLSALYPNALIANLYASSEIGQFIMGPTLRMMEDGVPGFSLLTKALVAAELVDNELVVTYAQNPAFPLLRYRTGDLFVVEETWTNTYQTKTPVLSWQGKGGVDVVRVFGTEIRSGSVDDFFTRLGLPISEYQVHMYKGEGASSLRIVLEYISPTSFAMPPMTIHKAFLETFYIASGQTLAAAVAAGLVDSVEVTPVLILSWQGAKRRVLINHIA